ncbi:hypothetical protein [Nocardia sp. NPDC057668]|uniref:hypothetical protein n=1 Tax=Nocardia sp. NPDC057668 TaxID=3346202 RepID=UPI00367315BE
MTAAENDEPSQVELIGPRAGAFTYLIGVVLIALGPLLALTGGGWADGLCTGVITLPIGVALVVSTVQWRANERRFQSAGVPGTARIISVDEIRAGGENPDTADLTVEISGDRFTAFTAVCTLDHHRELVRGHTFTVMVDPRDNSFAIGFDHLFPRVQDTDPPS